MKEKVKIDVTSEFGELEGVIIHSPGLEVEEMTPATAKRALYSDILNLSVACDEYKQLKGVLQNVSKCYEVKDLLKEVLSKQDLKENLIKEICMTENAGEIYPELNELEPEELARQLIHGVPLRRNNLTRYLSQERFSLWPLHNFIFTRDASMAFRDEILIGKMANKVRDRESIIMNMIFQNHPLFQAKTIKVPDSGNFSSLNGINIEGGDFQVAREDVLIIGTGVRTSTQGIDFIIENMKKRTDTTQHILVQELPDKPESFIHLDMVFTLLDRDVCMIYEPLILKSSRFHTIHIQIDNGEVTGISEEDNLLKGLKKLGMDMKPVFCGGVRDLWVQEREQWHSGANFFAITPGQVIGYERNVNTVEELSDNGFEVVKAKDIIEGSAKIPSFRKCVITIAGSELARGGGGARCMTMPILRKPVEW